MVVTIGGGIVLLAGFVAGAVLTRLVIYEVEGRPDIFGQPLSG